MLEIILTIVIAIACAYAAHEGVKWGNKRFRELDMSPNLCAIIALFFGLYGIIVMACYGACKVMIKRMLK